MGDSAEMPISDKSTEKMETATTASESRISDSKALIPVFNGLVEDAEKTQILKRQRVHPTPEPGHNGLVKDAEKTRILKRQPVHPTLEPGQDGLVEDAEKTQVQKRGSQTSTPLPLPEIFPLVQTPGRAGTRTRPISKQDVAKASALQERFRQLCLSLFFRSYSPVRSLGFTSSINGEGKSFLATVMANVLAHDSSDPVILLECNWEHPSLHEYFGIPATPGLGEWLRGECSETAIRHQYDHNLTIIPAGEGRRDAVRLLKQMRQKGLLEMVARSNELLVVDLPPVVTSAYGALAAALVEALLIVVHGGVTTDLMLTETYAQLKGLPVYGIILNQMESRIPRWIRQLL
jgi:Mrp family chromosome partitioning ATPase